MTVPGWYRWDGTVLQLRIHTEPRAQASIIAGLHGDNLKIRIAAQPLDGKANRALITLLAREFGVTTSRVEVRRGRAGRAKLVRIESPTRIPPILTRFLTIA